MKTAIRTFLLALLWSLGPAPADGVVIPTSGGITVLDGATLTEVRRVELKGGPLVAAHPASPVLATVVGEQLVFWNLPSFSEASRHQNPLFRGAVDLAFSLTGDELYILSRELKALVVFDLATSEVKRMLPVPGGVPGSVTATRSGVLVEAEHGVSLLSPDPTVGLLAQYRYPERLNSAALEEKVLFLARRGTAGVESYEARTGKGLGLVPTTAELSRIVTRSGERGLFALTAGGSVEAWTLGQVGSTWSHPGSFDQIFVGSDGSVVYAFDQEARSLVALDAGSGREVARASLTEESVGEPAVFAGRP